MIAKVTGILERVDENAVFLKVGQLTYQVLVPASALEALKNRWHNEPEQEISLHTLSYIEGISGVGNAHPRLVGFLHHKDLEFFERYIAVQGLGIRKALRSLTVPIRQLAEAIERNNLEYLVKLPEIGKRTAEKVVAELRGKVTEFALTRFSHEDSTPLPESEDDGVFPQAIEVFTQLGYKKNEAEELVRNALEHNPGLDTVDAIIKEVFQKQT